MNLDKVLTNFKDYHIPIALIIFITGTVVHIVHGLTADYVAFTSTILGFLGAHAVFANRSDT